MRNTFSGTLAVKALAETDIDSDTDTVEAVVDTGVFNNNFRDVLFVVNAHTLTDGTYSVAAQECDTSGGSYTAIPAYRLLGSPPSFAATDDDVVKSFGARPTKRYVQLVITSASTTTGGTLSAVAVLGNGSNNPAARS